MNFFFSFYGRIGRLEWWLTQLLLLAIFIFILIALNIVLGASLAYSPISLYDHIAQLGTNLLLFVMPLALLGLWINMATTVKRFHDRNKSGFWALIVFVPYVGALWQIIECGFLPGTSGSNDYDLEGSKQSSSGSKAYDESFDDKKRDETIDAVIARHVAKQQRFANETVARATKSVSPRKPSFGKR